ncbi:hypothetical protein [Desulfomarina profundi]|uniref:hypothetical protein n=1 Tax=Desulfomarina profundi TaxID=2772557 RepID=UPI001E63CCAF|nr:hypothetical protein [Desulfomarina profundi]
MYYAIFLFLVLLLPLRNIVLKVPNLFFGIDGFNLTNILFGFLALGILTAGNKEKTVVYRPKLQLPLILFVLYFFFQIFLQPGFHSYERLFAWWKDAFLFMFLLYFFVNKTITDTRKIALKKSQHVVIMN